MRDIDYSLEWFIIGILVGLLIRTSAVSYSRRRQPKLTVIKGGRRGK